jgi:hypothetical protein
MLSPDDPFSRISIKQMMQMQRIAMFANIKSQEEAEVEKWMEKNGGEKAVLENDEKIKQLLAFEKNIGAPQNTADPRMRNLKDKELAKEFRKEYRQDLDDVLKDNLETFTKTFQLGFEKMEQDLAKKIHHEGDRIISYMKGPAARVKDKVDAFLLEQGPWLCANWLPFYFTRSCSESGRNR